MGSSHTPGPWFSDRVLDLQDGWAVWDRTELTRLLVGVYSNYRSEADCRLAAAAPDLLEACTRLLVFNEELCRDVNVSAHYPSAEFARAAIARATGAER